MLLLAFLLVLLLPITAALLFNARIAYRIPSHIFRAGAAVAFYLAVLAGVSWACLPLVIISAFNLSDMYPVVKKPINDSYYFTQQEYGFATMISQGYNLTFYRRRPFWFDQELGKVQLECTGKETIRPTLRPARNQHVQLRIEADTQLRLDTALNANSLFDFRRTFENRTINWANRR